MFIAARTLAIVIVLLSRITGTPYFAGRSILWVNRRVVLLTAGMLILAALMTFWWWMWWKLWMAL